MRAKSWRGGGRGAAREKERETLDKERRGGKRGEDGRWARSMDGVDTVESEGFLVGGCLAVRQGISGARRLPFSPRGDLLA